MEDVPSLPENALRQWGGIEHVLFCLLHPATLWGLRTGKAFWRRWEEGREQQGVAGTCAQTWQQSRQPCLAYTKRERYGPSSHCLQIHWDPSSLLPVLESNPTSVCHTQVLRTGGEIEKEACHRLVPPPPPVLCYLTRNKLL